MQRLLTPHRRYTFNQQLDWDTSMYGTFMSAKALAGGSYSGASLVQSHEAAECATAQLQRANVSQTDLRCANIFVNARRTASSLPCSSRCHPTKHSTRSSLRGVVESAG